MDPGGEKKTLEATAYQYYSCLGPPHFIVTSWEQKKRQDSNLFLCPCSLKRMAAESGTNPSDKGQSASLENA